MVDILFDDSISKLGIDKDIVLKLEKNDIYTVDELRRSNRKRLKEIGFCDREIKHIIIKLQLNSFDLDNKVYNKN